MRDTWILDVLADMQGFAHANGMPSLTQSLEDTRKVAQAELSRRASRPQLVEAEGRLNS